MRVGIVGGGITGLVIAHEIVKRGNEIFLFESGEKLGGLARTFKKQNWHWPLEEFFHHFFIFDDQVKNFLKELGLENELFYRDVKTSIYFEGSIYPFDSVSDFLSFPHLGSLDKLRMGLAIFVLRQLPFLPIFEKYTALDLFPKLIGASGWDTVWGRLMEGKFGGFSNKVSFSWLWARVKMRSKSLGYLNGGCQKIFEELRKGLKSKGKIFICSPVSKISPLKPGWKIKTGNKEVLVDKVVLAIPLSQALDLTQQLITKEELDQWRKLETIGALVLVLRMKNKFLSGGTYWLNILEKEFPFVALVEHTNFVNPENYGNEYLVYVGGYYDPDNPLFNWSKKKILSHFSPYLRRLNPSFEKFLIDFDVFSSLCAQPIIPTNYSRIAPSLELVPGSVFWATANHIYPWDRGMNFSIKLAKEVAKLV